MTLHCFKLHNENNGVQSKIKNRIADSVQSEETARPDPHCLHTLREQAYSNILKILPPKNESFQMRNSKCFHISAQNIDCGYSLEPPRQGGSNEFSQSMF